MIIKTAPPHAHIGKLVAHLERTDDGNEQIRFLGARGVVAGEDLREALTEMKALSRGSRCEKPLYHVAFNAAPGEELSPGQWERCLELWEAELGLEDHQRAVVQHFKDGRWHTHAVWNRVDAETGLAVSIGRDHFKAKAVAREIERELGLREVSDERPSHRLDQQPPERWEAEQSRRTHTDPHEARDAILRAWQCSDDGRSFQHALEAEGLVLAQGEQRPFVVVDGQGNFYALGGGVLPGERMAGIRERLTDLDTNQLPTVEQARSALLRAVEPESSNGRGKVGEGASAPPAGVSDPLHAKFRDLQREAKQNYEEKRQLAAQEQEKQRQALAESHVRDRERVEAREASLWERLTGQGERIEREKLAALALIEREREAQRRAHEQRQAEIRAEYEAQAKALREQEKAEKALLKQRGAEPDVASPAEALNNAVLTAEQRAEKDTIFEAKMREREERRKEQERQRLLERGRGGPSLGD